MRTAEVTIGGVDTRDLSSKTMQAQLVSGLYFIGETVDVTGHLGGFNFNGRGPLAMPVARWLKGPSATLPPARWFPAG